MENAELVTRGLFISVSKKHLPAIAILGIKHRDWVKANGIETFKK